MRLLPPSRYIHIALLFVCHFFLGTFVAVWGSYQYQQSRWFASLSQEQGKQLLALRETLLAAPSPARGTPDALQRDVSRLETLRRRAPQDTQAILMLRIAADRALLARIYRNENNRNRDNRNENNRNGNNRDANDVGAAKAQSEAARSLLRELGWKDVSDATLSELAERRLTTIDTRDVR